MKSVVIIAALAFFAANTSFAIVSHKQVQAARAQVDELLSQTTGLNGIGTSSCERGTNQRALPTRDVKDACISVTFETKTAEKAFTRVFNDDVRVGGVAIQRKTIGRIVAQ